MTIVDIQNGFESYRAGKVTERFRTVHGGSALVFRAPGRVNLIGEHTDYNDGFVMPAAIGFSTWAVIGSRDDRRLKAYSEQFGETVELDVDHLEGPPRKHWSDYIRGVAALLKSAGYPVKGANLLIDSEVPMGAGLSSSAAIEVSTALALAAISGVNIPPHEVAVLCQRAENEYSGARCGLMDQFIACFGKANHALMLDCRSLDYHHLPLPQSVRLVICNTMVRHELSGGEYNDRRTSCERAVGSMRHFLPGIRALRDATLNDLEQHRDALGEVDYRRCRHVVTEDERVLLAADALKTGDMVAFGKLMYESHASLRDDYEVSCDELNLLVEIASGIEGVYGARMTGGGFGGCTVNLVANEEVARFKIEIAREYAARTGTTPPIYVCSAAAGAGRVEI